MPIRLTPRSATGGRSTPDSAACSSTARSAISLPVLQRNPDAAVPEVVTNLARIPHEPLTNRRAAVVRGITWTALSQAFDVVLSLASMLVLVRIIAPSEYGRAAA